MFNFLRRYAGRFSRDMGIDLGTANTLVHVQGRGILLREPSVVAINKHTNAVKAVGEEAKRMLGRTPGNIVAIRPLKDGVIADFDQTERMMRYFIEKVHRRKGFVHPLVVVGIPSGITEVEKMAVIEAAKKAGAKDAFTIEEPFAAAIGAGLPVAEPVGSMIVDIGGGTSEVAVISLGGIVAARSIRVAGDEIDEAIIAYVRQTYNLFIGDRTAEDCKITIGSAFPLGDEMTMELRGRDLVSGLPRSAVVTSEEIREAICRPRQRHRGDGQGNAGRHAARTGRRHHGPRHRAGGRRRAAARPGPADLPRDRDARPHRARPALLRRDRHGPVSGDDPARPVPAPRGA